MATIRAYTTIEQSRKLAEILPLESADMMYHSVENEYGTGTFVATSKLLTNGLRNDDFYIDDIPCWSLAALFSVLPRIDIEKEICSDDTYDYRVKAYIGDGYIGDWFDNPIDACVDMIIKLKEKGLL